MTQTVATLRAVFTADTKNFEAGVKRTQTSINRMESGFSSATKAVTSFTKNAAIAAGAFAGVGKVALDLASIGRGAMESKIALTGLAGGAKEAEKWISAVKRATDGASTSGAAAAQAYQLMKFGFADSAEGAEKFLRTIRIVTAINPQLGNTEQTLQQLQLTLANMSYMRLDQLGLSVAEVKDRMAALRAETAGLSTEQAFQIAVMQGLDEQAAIVGEGILGVGQNMDWLQGKSEELREVLAIRLQRGFEGAATGARGLYEIIAKLNEQPEINIPLTIKATIEGVTGEAATDWVIGAMGSTGGKVGLGFAELFGLAPSGTTRAAQGLKNQNDAAAAAASLGTLGAYTQTMPPASIAGEPPEWIQAYLHWYANQDKYAVDFPQFYWMTQGPDQGNYGGWMSGILSKPAATRSGLESFIAGQYGFEDWQLASALSGFDTFTPQDVYGLQYNMGGIARFQQQQDLYALRQRTFDWQNPDAQAAWWNQRMSARAQHPGLADDMGMGMAQDMAVGRSAELVQGLSTFGGSIASSLAEAAASAGDLVATFDSLDSKFGVGGSAFDKDVYGEMADALRGVEIDAGAAEEAMSAFEWATGLATGSSVLFDDRLAILTQRFADGEMTATEYADAVRQFSMMDFTWVDKITQGMDFDTAQQYIDAISNLTTFTGFQGGGMSQEEANPWLQGVGLGGGEETSIFQPLIDDAATATGDITASFATATDDMGNDLLEFHNLHTGEYQSLAVEATSALETIRQKAQAVMGGTYTMTITTGGVESILGNKYGSSSGYTPIPPGRAAGGPVSAGQAYIVGEDGPELFVPGASGSIVSNGGGRSAGGAGATNVEINIYDATSPLQVWDALKYQLGLEGISVNRVFGTNQ